MEKNLINIALEERNSLADELQNEISQSLACVLLRLQLAVKDHQLQNDESLKLAEANLTRTINRVRALHYFLSNKLPS